MKAYKAETKEIVRQFLARKLTFPDCIAALDATCVGLVAKLTGEQIPELRAIMLANQRYRHG